MRNLPWNRLMLEQQFPTPGPYWIGDIRIYCTCISKNHQQHGFCPQLSFKYVINEPIKLITPQRIVDQVEILKALLFERKLVQ